MNLLQWINNSIDLCYKTGAKVSISFIEYENTEREQLTTIIVTKKAYRIFNVSIFSPDFKFTGEYTLQHDI